MGILPAAVSSSFSLKHQLRMITFLKSKLKQVPNKSSDLVKTTLPTLSFTTLKVKLSFVKNAAISIKPRKIYHPTIINACEAMFKKHPDQLVSEEIVNCQ